MMMITSRSRSFTASTSQNFKYLIYLSHSTTTTTTTQSPPSKSPVHQNLISIPSLVNFASCFSSKPTPSPPSFLRTRDGNYEDSTPPASVCPGCGIRMQDADPKLLGFVTRPSVKDPRSYKASNHLVPVSFESEFSGSVKRGLVVDPERLEESEATPGHDVMQEKKPVVCVRCHSLRHYGKVKDPSLENLLPEFDFYHTVGRRLVLNTGARTVVLLVVDAVDFDGSFPKGVVRMVSNAIEENYTAWKEGRSGNVARIVLVVTKLDLLPASVSPVGFEHWVRRRAREGGASIIKQVHFVSAVKDWGLKSLVEDVIELAGPRGNVWAVGMQNAGKSTLLNSMGKYVGGRGHKLSHLTEAPVPGTTLGIVRVEGALPGNAKLFDTPGLLNPHQITTRLTRDEQKLVHISKELKPRTYRIKEGHSVHIGGLMRVDIDELSVDSLYVTVWASPYLPLHMGKTENASTMVDDHFGHQLQPPIGEKRAKEMGKWVRHEFHISGSSWDASAVDIAVGGLGWFAIGLKGEATVSAWTYEGIDVIVRDALVPSRSQNFEVAGFTVSKIVSKADQALKKTQHKPQENKKHSDQEVVVTSCSTIAADANAC